MEEKIFQAETMMAALEKVQNELGPDAMVVSVREIQSPVWSFNKRNVIEIKAAPAGTVVKPKAGGLPAPSQPAAPKAAPRPQAAPAAAKPKPAPQPAQTAITDDISTIEWVSDDNQTSVTAKPAVPAKPAAPVAPTVPAPAAREVAALPPSLLKLKQILSANDLAAETLERNITQAHETLSPLTLDNEAAVRKFLAKKMEAELRISPPRDLKPPAPIVCLVGTSGSGKTSLAGRMAMHYGSRLEKNVVWICADVFRAGAIAEARTLTDALCMPLTVVYTPADLKQALEDNAGADLIIVDMAGYNPLIEKEVAEMGYWLAEMPKRCLLLVASASQKEKDLFQAAASFGVFGLDGIAVTKMDETLTLGSVYNLAHKTQVPLVYFCGGKGPTGSFQSASAERLVSALFGHGGF